MHHIQKRRALSKTFSKRQIGAGKVKLHCNIFLNNLKYVTKNKENYVYLRGANFEKSIPNFGVFFYIYGADA